MATSNMKRHNNQFSLTEKTHEGAPASNITDLQALRRSTLTCLLNEDTFYEDGVLIKDRIKALIAKLDPTEVIKVAVEAKEVMKLRHIPLFMMREVFRKLSDKNQTYSVELRQHARRTLESMITRPDDVTEFLAMYFDDGRKPIAGQIKKALSSALTKFKAYSIAKYQMDNRSISLRDAFRILHPKAKDDEMNAIYKSLVVDKNLVEFDTWESLRSTCKTDEEKRAVWEKLITDKKLGGMATLMNLRNMQKDKLSDKFIMQAIKNINDPMLLPIKFVTAARYAPNFVRQLEEKFFELYAGKDKIPGKTVIMVDVSGSMEWPLGGQYAPRVNPRTGEPATIRTDLASALAMCASELFEQPIFVKFADEVRGVPSYRGFALRDAIVNGMNGGTRLGEAVRTVDAQYPDADRLIVLTDEQSSDPVKFPSNIKKAYMINVSSNKNGIGYHQWIHIDGWSDKILDFIVEYENRKQGVSNGY